jgi:hypothetical protein
MKHHQRLANITVLLAVAFTWGSSFAVVAPMQDAGERLTTERPRSGASRLVLDTVTTSKQPAQPIVRRDPQKPPQTNLPTNTKTKKFWCEDDCAPKQRPVDTQQSKEQKTLSKMMKQKSKTDETIIQNMK